MMDRSEIIEVDGLFVATALRQADGVRLVAIDLRLAALDGTVLPSVAEAQRVAGVACHTGQIAGGHLPGGPA